MSDTLLTATRRPGQAVPSRFNKKWKYQRGHLAALVLIVVIGAGLRVAFLYRVIREVEAITFHRYVSKPFTEAISTYDSTNNHPLNTALARASILLLGNHLLALRLPVLLAGILIVPATYSWAEQEYGEPAGLLAAALTSASSFLVDYATQARGYSLVALFFMLALIVARRLINRWNTRTALLLAVVNALAMYAIPVALYSVGIVLVWLAISLLAKHRDGDWLSILRGGILSLCVTGALTAILYSPIVLNAGLPALIANPVVTPLSWEKFVQIVPLWLSLTWDAWFRDVPSALVWLMLACFAGSIFAHRRIASSAFPLALSIALLPAVITLQRAVPYTRIFLFIMPVYLSSVAGGFMWGLRWLGGLVGLTVGDRWICLLSVVTALGLGGLVYSHESVVEWDVNPILEKSVHVSDYLASEVQPGDGITGHPRAAEAVSYYLDTQNRPVVLITGDPEFPFPRAHIPSRLYVLVPVEWPNPLRSARYLLGQIRGFDPTAYTVPELIKVVDGINVYVVTEK